jgi:hypothetical protein
MSTAATTIEELILQTDAAGAPVRLEYVRGHLKWEASPASRHHKALRRIERAVEPIPSATIGCGCYTLADVLIRFPDPDGSLKRPDIAIFCAEPPDSDEALEELPAAIIEILSIGYEEKDLGADGASFYLAYVPEVLVVDPRTGLVHHYRADRPPAQYTAPITVDLQCGCRCTI